LVSVDQQQQLADFLRTSCGLAEINFVEASSRLALALCACIIMPLVEYACDFDARNWAPIAEMYGLGHISMPPLTAHTWPVM
jgi:hypothetical protein